MLKVIIKGQIIFLPTSSIIAGDTIDMVSAEFHFTPEWNDLEKVAFFEKDGAVYPFLLKNDRIYVDDGLNLPAGRWNVTVRGYDTPEELAKDNLYSEVYPRLTTGIASFYVIRNGPEGNGVLEPAISGWVEKTYLEASTAKDAARLVQDKADSGEFNGKSAYEIAIELGFEGSEEEWTASLKGEQGEPGEDYILTNNDRRDIADIVIADLDIKELTWENIENKPDDIVYDAKYVHTDKNYTAEEKSKLAGISNNAEINTIESISVNDELIEPNENKNVNITIPVKTSDLTNDSGYIIKEEDPTVPNWAKQPNKPSYTASEVGALPNTTVIPTVPAKVSAFQNDAGYLTEHQDISEKADRTEIPKKVSELENDSQYATESFVNSSIGTNTAYYINDDGEPFESFEALKAYSGEITNNDYAFVVGQDSVGNVTYTRYKYNADNQEWAKEYVLNNSSFTDKQWQSINSEITASKVAQITTNKNDINTAKESIETLESNVETLSTTMKQKADKSDIPDVIVEDIQVNGASIVSDGVATIPIADAQNKHGVFFVNSTYGISTNASGRLTITSAGSTDIANRTNAYKSIVPKNLVEAVDSVLCSAVEGEQLTDEKKAAARNRLGVSPYDDTEIKEDLSQCLKEPESIAVGKYFRIAAIDENGHAVLEAVDAPQGGVTDVRVADTSVVQDGVASIQKAVTGSLSSAQFGVIKPHSNSFTSLQDALIVKDTTISAINNRTSGGNVITANAIDYAVKAAMCDGKGAAWSDEEKTAAQERIGLETIVEDLSTKATNPANPVVGQWGRVASIGEDGQPVWETAELPIATTNSAGILRLGTGLRSSGKVATPNPASYTSGIENRNPGALSTNTQSCYAPITPNNADYMILRSFTDGIAPEWTLAEQASARQRLGLREKIIDSGLLHPEDDAKRFDFNFAEYIPDGYIVSRINILYETPTGVNITNNANITTNSSNGIIGFIPSNAFTTSANRFALLDIYDGFDGYVFCDGASGSGNSTSGNTVTRQYYRNAGSIAGSVLVSINFNFAPKADNNIRIKIILKQVMEE